ncbi:unnamed protein product, partial [Heterosigma akashiwo]
MTPYLNFKKQKTWTQSKFDLLKKVEKRRGHVDLPRHRLQGGQQAARGGRRLWERADRRQRVRDGAVQLGEHCLRPTKGLGGHRELPGGAAAGRHPRDAPSTWPSLSRSRGLPQRRQVLRDGLPIRPDAHGCAGL